MLEQELAVQNEVGLVDNPLKISWLEGRPQGLEDPRHPGMSQVKSQTSLCWACSGFGGPFPVWVLLRALFLKIQVTLQVHQLEQEDCVSMVTPFPPLSASRSHLAPKNS